MGRFSEGHVSASTATCVVLLVRIPAVQALVRPLIHSPGSGPRMPLAERNEREARTGLRREDHPEWPLRRRPVPDRDVHLQEAGQPRPIFRDLCAALKLGEVDPIPNEPWPLALRRHAPA